MRIRSLALGFLSTALAFGLTIGAATKQAAKNDRRRAPVAFGSVVGTLMSDDQLLALARSGGDCTAELQARIEAFRPEGGVVNLPNGGASYRIPGGLVLGGNAVPLGQGPPTSLRGCPGASTLAYDGDPTRAAFRVDRVWGYNLAGFSVYRTPSDRQGTGIECAPPPDIGVPGVGTVSGTALWQQVQARYFAVGAQLGSLDGQWATSEIQFDSCVFGDNDIGVRIDGFNTLDFTFNMLNMSANRIGLQAGSGGVVAVTGGSASGNEEFDFAHQHAHPMTIRSFRSETTNCFYAGTATVAPTHATIDSCLIVQRPNPTRPAISTGWGCELIVRNTTIMGGDGLGSPTTSGIYYVNNSGHSNIVIENCGICSPVPITLVPQAADTPPAKLTIRNCWQIDQSNNFIKHFDNFEGLAPTYPLPVVPPPQVNTVIDNGAAGYSETGTWTGGSSGYGGTHRYAAVATPATATAAWQATGLPAGSYDVYATWVPFGNHSTQQSYSVYDGATLLGAFAVNQVGGPGGPVVGGVQFQKLGTFTASSGTLKVVTNNSASNGGYATADAALFTTAGLYPPAVVGRFGIDLRFGDSVPEAHRAAFRAAADRWQQVIVGDLPDAHFPGYFVFPAADVDDLLIDVLAVGIDGPGGALADSGPDFLRPGSFLPFHAVLRIDAADAAGLYDSGALYYVALHEIGHCLGFGTVWEYLGLKAGDAFVGPNAVREYGGPVPLEVGGGPGTAGKHWSEAVFGNEIMTGYLSAGPGPIGRVTIASLADLGYTVNMGAAQ